MEQTAVGSIIIDLDNECKARGMFVNWDMYLAMEKDQIMNAYVDGKPLDFSQSENARQYYNETYGK
jgi:hypothetical protein